MTLILALAFFGGLVVVLIGAILFFIDYAQNRSKKKSLKIVGIGLAVSIIGLGIESTISYHESRVAKIKQEKIKKANAKKDKVFKETESEFLADYYTAWEKAEKLGNSVSDDWEKAIDNDPDGYDPDEALKKIEEKDSDEISKIHVDVAIVDEDLAKLKKNNTGKYKIEEFKKADRNLNKLSNFVTSPSGSYMDFGNDFSDYDDEVSNSFDNLRDQI